MINFILGLTLISSLSAFANQADNYKGRWTLAAGENNYADCIKTVDIDVRHFIQQSSSEAKTGIWVRYLAETVPGNYTEEARDILQMSNVFFEQNFSDNSYIDDQRINLSSYSDGPGFYSVSLSVANWINNEWIQLSGLSLMLHRDYGMLTIHRLSKSKYTNCHYSK